MGHPAIRSFRADFVSLRTKEIWAVAPVEPAAPVQPMGTLVMLGIDEVIQVHQHSCPSSGPVVLGVGAEVALRNRVLSILYADGDSGVETDHRASDRKSTDRAFEDNRIGFHVPRSTLARKKHGPGVRLASC